MGHMRCFCAFIAFLSMSPLVLIVLPTSLIVNSPQNTKARAHGSHQEGDIPQYATQGPTPKAARPQHGQQSKHTQPVTTMEFHAGIYVSNRAGHSTTALPAYPQQRLVIFGINTLPTRGQGLGNLLNGLWVAHIFARWFDRNVCVNWADFNAAFVPISQGMQDACEKAIASMQKSPLNVPKVSAWNFGATNTFAEINATFSSAHQIIAFDGNDWPEPSWPSESMHQLFFDNYVPTTKLQVLLPPSCRGSAGLLGHACGPKRVLHLRSGDNAGDRRGVFRCRRPYESIKAAFNLSRYTIFADREDVYRGLAVHKTGPAFHTSGLASWADWVAILTAREAVFHTPSGFSESAIRVSRNHEIGGLIAGRLLPGCSSSRGVKVEAEVFDPPNTRWHKD